MKYEKSDIAAANNGRKKINGKIRSIKRTSLDKLKLIFDSEIITSTDSYLHYSNQILFDINGSRSMALVLILNFFNNISAQISVAVIFFDRKPRIYYAEIKEFTKTFDGVIERYCGVPP